MPRKLEGVDIFVHAFFKENPNKKFTTYEIYREIQKKYSVMKFSHVVLYRIIREMLRNPEFNLKTEKIGNYTIIWYEKPITSEPVSTNDSTLAKI